jgi:hypothetical protein
LPLGAYKELKEDRLLRVGSSHPRWLFSTFGAKFEAFCETNWVTLGYLLRHSSHLFAVLNLCLFGLISRMKKMEGWTSNEVISPVSQTLFY